MSRLMMMGAGPSGPGDTFSFYSQRVFDLFPQMATTNSGWATHSANVGSFFGSLVESDSANDSDYIDWTVWLPAGSYKLQAYHSTTSSRGKADLAIDGGAVVDTLDTYSAGTVNNASWLSAAFTVTEGSHTIRLTKNGKHASSAGYTIGIQHCQLIKQDSTSALSSVANVPHVIDIPVVFADSATNWNTLGMDTSVKFGTYLQSSGAQNATVTFSFWAPKGNATLAFLRGQFASHGIYSVSVDGASWGTTDAYGSLDYNVLDTSLSGTITSTGMHTITFTMATKNALSSGYVGSIRHIQIRMTSITEPLAQDLAPEVALFWPVFKEADTGWSGLSVSSSQAYYSYNTTGGNGLNAEMTLSSNVVLRPGTYRLDIHGLTGTAYGIHHALIDTVDLGTVDAYHATGGYNKLLSIASLALAGFSPHTLKLKMSTKNASATQYHGYITLARLIRTGA